MSGNTVGESEGNWTDPLDATVWDWQSRPCAILASGPRDKGRGGAWKEGRRGGRREKGREG